MSMGTFNAKEYTQSYKYTNCSTAEGQFKALVNSSTSMNEEKYQMYLKYVLKSSKELTLFTNKKAHQ